MENFTVSGKAYIFGDNIDTDQIYPGRYLDLRDHKEIASHAMEGVDPGFAGSFEPGGILVAGRNFGCGSSREHAARTLKENRVSLVIAESFARIFFRNAINLGIPLLTCPGVKQAIKQGDVLEADLLSGVIYNRTSGLTIRTAPLSRYILDVLADGGIVQHFRKNKK